MWSLQYLISSTLCSYAINTPFQALDINKDGVVNEEDYRVARERLGKVFCCDTDGESKMCLRSFANTIHGSGGGDAGAGGGGGGHKHISSILFETAAAPSNTRHPLQFDREQFKKLMFINEKIPMPTTTTSSGEKEREGTTGMMRFGDLVLSNTNK